MSAIGEVPDGGDERVGALVPDGEYEGKSEWCYPSDIATISALSGAGVGSVFEKTATGWNVKYVDGGTVIHVQGVTIPAAIGSHGQQRVHPTSREQLAKEARDAEGQA